MLCQKIISGGQTGVDRGALDAALSLGFPCGGWCPKMRLAEDGVIGEKYPLKECTKRGYAERTKRNVEDSDGTLILHAGPLTGGTRLTFQHAKFLKKPVFLLNVTSSNRLQDKERILAEIDARKIQILNIAGPRASEWSEGYRMAKDITSELIRHCKPNHQGTAPAF
jgi:hypothetical protein